MTRMDDRVVSDRMEQIQTLLAAHDADRSDERLLAFQSAVASCDTAAVRESLEQGIDLAHPIVAPLSTAIYNEDLDMAKLLLEHGASPEGGARDDDEETPLMQAAVAGSLDMLRLLIEAGADAARYAYDDPQCTAEFLARDAGHVEVADWLLDAAGERSGAQPESTSAQRNPKFAELYAQRTDGINCGFTTDDVVRVLTDWDERFGIEISEVGGDRVVVRFAKLPEDLASFASEVYEFCPDVIEQGFGCMGEMVEMSEETGRDIPADIQALIEGVDFEDSNYGLTLLTRDLKARRCVALWWD